ncbi:MSCRAMM family adhesin SdrC, partial [Staphylococcus agnetis]|uniref:YSIRK-type signal peptide-containing protein n=1 Tax=Staphylococcus agnetis TaxID=985762 RepID=UPI00208F6D13
MKIIKSKQKFSIRKHSLGVGSVLIGIGLSFAIFSTEAKASENASHTQDVKNEAYSLSDNQVGKEVGTTESGAQNENKEVGTTESGAQN